MKTSAKTLKILLSVAKTHVSGWYVIIALLALSVTFAGCEKQDLVMSSDGCEEVVKAVKVPCGYGVLSDIWFVNSEGEYLQPWIMYGGREPMPRFTPPVAGQYYKIGYVETQRDDRHDGPRCMAALPQSKAIDVTCLSAVATTDL